MVSLPDIESLRCFVAAAELLSFRRAAERVGLTAAALGQRIKLLESQFDTPLFARTTRRVALTEAGMAMLPQAEATLEAAQRCAAAARGELEAAPMALTIGTRHELGLSWLTPMLRELAAVRSNLTLNLYVGAGSDLTIRVRHRDIDCAVLSSAPPDATLDQAMLHPERYALVAAPRTLERRPLRRISDATNHVLLDINATLPLFSYWRDSPETPRLRFASIRYLGTIATIRKAVLAGDGIAVLPEYFIRGDLSRGRLRALFAKHPLASDHFRLLYRAADPRRALFERLAEVMRTHPLR